MNVGIKINRLIVSGATCDDVFIKFSSSAHFIVGPSNTGKSYIYQCLKYLLGSKKKPKRINQSYDFDFCYLEFILPDKSINTIKRSLLGGDADLYLCGYDDISIYPKEPEALRVEKKATNKIRTVNSYFLSTLSLNDKKVRRNKSGVTDSLYFSDLKHLFLIDEISIIKEESPIYTGQFGKDTKEESVLRFLLTGKDDSSISSKPKKNVIDNRKGRVEVIDSLIDDYQKELPENEHAPLTIEAIDDQIDKLLVSITRENKKLNFYYEKSNEYDSTINIHWTKWKENESRLLTVNELVSRLELLDQHYDSDLSRLESLQESSLAYQNLDIGLCPVCKSEYDLDGHDACNADDVDKILQGASAEIEKIKSLKVELSKTRDTLFSEKYYLDLEIKINKKDHDSIQLEKDEFTSEAIKKTVEKLEDLKLTLRDCKQISWCLEKLEDLYNKKSEYEFEIDPMDGNYEFDNLTTSIASDFCEVVQGLLDGWGYSKDTEVSFSEGSCDLIIDGFDRNLAGKGYRALSYSAFTIGLMHICIKNGLPHSGVVILDSPLCTLRSRHMKESLNKDSKDIISDDIKESFYKNIAKYKGLGQIIVLENDGPSNPSSLDVGYTEFTEDVNVGRYGFFKPI